MKIEAIKVTRFRLPNGEEYDTRKAAERAYACAKAELVQELCDNTSADTEVVDSVAEYLLDRYTLIRKEN